MLNIEGIPGISVEVSTEEKKETTFNLTVELK